MIRVVAFLVTLTLTLPGCNGYANGAPETHCVTMMPDHGAAAQTSAAPFTITASKPYYNVSDTMDVTIESTDSTNFEGFLLEARTADGSLVGTFNPLNGDPLIQTLHCTGMGNKLAVTHQTGFLQTSITVPWTAPVTNEGNLTFTATIVRTKLVFWTGVVSEDLLFVDDVPATTTATTTTNNNNGGGNNGGIKSTSVSTFLVLLASFGALLLARKILY